MQHGTTEQGRHRQFATLLYFFNGIKIFQVIFLIISLLLYPQVLKYHLENVRACTYFFLLVISLGIAVNFVNNTIDTKHYLKYLKISLS